MAAPPVIYEGEAVFGKVYQNISKDEKKPGYMRLVVGVAKETDAVLNFLKEKVEPIYEDSDGLQITGALFDGNSAISWNIWDTQEAMDSAVEKLQGALVVSQKVIYLMVVRLPTWVLYTPVNYLLISKKVKHQINIV